MNICGKCKKEMKCIKTGVIAVWNGSHCRAGDMFECTKCGSEILVANNNSFYGGDIKEGPYVFKMDGE